jgi:hypothetical protein
MAVINIIVPSSWGELTQKQLRYACFLLSSMQYEPDQIKSLCIIRWGRLSREQLSVISPEQIAPFLPVMDFLFQIPDMPVRLERIGGAQAVNEQLKGMPFQHYLVIENMYQGYIRTKQMRLIEDMTPLLYGERLNLSAEEAYSIFLWVASVKQLFARRFPHFFVSSPVEKQEQDIHATLRRSMNMQIRALTKGDITKEKEILAMDVWRALTELDAQAEEYEQLKKQYPNVR